MAQEEAVDDFIMTLLHIMTDCSDSSLEEEEQSGSDMEEAGECCSDMEDGVVCGLEDHPEQRAYVGGLNVAV